MTQVKRIPTPFSCSAAVEAGDFAILGFHRGWGDGFIAQLDDAFSNLKKTLAKLNIPPENLIIVYVWLRDINNVREMEKRFLDYFKKNRYPARTGGFTEFVDEDCLFMIEGIACRKGVDMAEVKRITSNFSFSYAVGAGDYVFLGHHRGFGRDFTTQFDGTFEFLKKTLAEFKLTLADLIKVNVHLKDIKDLPEIEKRFNNYFEKSNFPARMTTTTKFVDEDCLLMIEGIGYRKSK